jgi:hypothetical protein
MRWDGRDGKRCVETGRVDSSRDEIGWDGTGTRFVETRLDEKIRVESSPVASSRVETKLVKTPRVESSETRYGRVELRRDELI